MRDGKKKTLSYLFIILDTTKYTVSRIDLSNCYMFNSMLEKTFETENRDIVK